MRKELLILGGPGCGKTTRLLSIVESLFASGVNSHEIAYLAFTRKAAQEARDRCIKNFNLTNDDMPYFRTLHSFSFAMLGIQSDSLMMDANYREIGDRLNIRFSRMVDGFGLHQGAEDGDKFANIEQLSRLCQEPLTVTCRGQFASRYWDVKLYADTLHQYKKAKHLLDFTDILQRFLDDGGTPKLRAVIIDEAQDLSPLQWRVVEKITQDVQEVYYAGDDDQAIYKWAGADVNHFLNLKAEREVLPVSYRLKSEIFDVCNKISNRIKHRYKKDWKPYAAGGEIRRYSEVDYVDMSNASWLVLARNSYLLKSAQHVLFTLGYPFMINSRSTVNNEVTQAIYAWEMLRKGHEISGETVKHVYKKMFKECVQHGFKSGHTLADASHYTLDDLKTHHGLNTTQSWMDTLTMPPRDKEYYRAVLRRGESLVKEPRIMVSTIHAVKGGEADNVLLIPDMSYASYNSFQKSADDEARVFYVAASRAKETLNIIHPATQRYFPL